jgi:hypothetical protein
MKDKKNGKNMRTEQWLKTTYEIGKSYKVSSLRESYGILNSGSQVNVYNTCKSAADVFVLQHWYKNMFDDEKDDMDGNTLRIGLRTLLQKIDEIQNNPNWICEQEQGALIFWIGPRGGNGMPAGTHGQPSFGAHGKETSHYTPGFPLPKSNV